MISNEIGTGNINLVDHKTLKRIINDVLTDVSSVKSTLGPGGKANLVHDSNTTDLYQSKDGYRIVMDMHYNDYFYDAMAKLIKDASAHNNVIIGDGTTSAIVILDKFYKELEELVESHKEGFEHISLTGVVNILETLKGVLKDILIEKGYVKFLNEYSKDDQKKIIKKVATIAANNDKTVGDYVAKLFDKIIDDGKYEELFVDITPNYANDLSETNEIGFRMDHSYIDRIYTTEPDRQTAKYENPRFLMIEGAILEKEMNEAIRPIIDYVCLMNNQPLVIVAADFPIKVAQQLYSLRIGGQRRVITDEHGKPQEIIMPPLPIMAIQVGAGDDESHERYIDLEAVLGGRAIPAITETWETLGSSPKEWEQILGGAEKITCIPYECSIVGGHGSTSVIEARIKKLQDELDHMVLISDKGASELRKATYKERIGILKSNMVSIRVGGATFKERQYMCLVYEDAIYAVKSTIKNGFTMAGQVSVNHLIHKFTDEIVERVISILEKEGRNVTFGRNRDNALKSAIKAILKVTDETIGTAYNIAISNAIFDEEEKKDINHRLYEESKDLPESYNLMTGEYETINDPIDERNMIVPGNTDYETFSAIVGITNLFLNTDNLETLYIPVTPKDTHKK